MPVDFLLSKDSFINSQAQSLASSIKELVDKVETTIHNAEQAQKHAYNYKHQPQTFVMGSIVLIFTKNLKLLGIQNLQP